MATMNRRDFLRLRMAQGRRVLEVSCQALYMRLLDAESMTPPDSVSDFDPVLGEPPAVFETRTPHDLRRQLEQDVAEVDVVKLLESRWLDTPVLGGFLTPVLTQFEARGGRVERDG
jgi:hypothetical protein